MEWFSAVVALAACAAAWGAAVLARRSAPIVQRQALMDWRTEFDAVAANLATIRNEWTAYRQSVESVLETVEDRLESIEQKRRRVSATESRAKAREKEPDDPADMIGAARRARAMGIPGI